jgi:hypothetical protein
VLLQPVAFMIAAIVVPLGCLSRARTASCLVPLRAEPAEVFPRTATVTLSLPQKSTPFCDEYTRDVLTLISGSKVRALVRPPRKSKSYLQEKLQRACHQRSDREPGAILHAPGSYIGLAGLALRIERIVLEVEIVLGRFA